MGVLNVHHDGDSPSPLLTIPAELRNQIYAQLFPQPLYTSPRVDEAVQLPSLADFGKSASYAVQSPVTGHAAITGACRQLCDETQLMYFENTLWYLNGPMADPDTFATRTAHLSPRRKRAIRHVVLSARISHMRSLNELWDSMPFGDRDMYLETLTLVPHSPDTRYAQPYAEIADLSQCHTLAYVLTETLKGLRNVQTVIVRNEGCFNPVIWRLSYRSMVYRLWKWGGRLCDLRFKEDEGDQIFSISFAPTRLGLDGTTKSRAPVDGGWRDVMQELARLLGTEGSRDGMELVTQ